MKKMSLLVILLLASNTAWALTWFQILVTRRAQDGFSVCLDRAAGGAVTVTSSIPVAVDPVQVTGAPKQPAISCVNTTPPTFSGVCATQIKDAWKQAITEGCPGVSVTD